MEVHGLPAYVERGRMVQVEDDVQNVIRDIRELAGDRVSVYWNWQTNRFDLVEHCLDHTDRLIFSVAELDQRVVQRLREADHWHGRDTPDHVLGDGEDFVAQVDRENDARQAAIDAEAMEKIQDAGERLAWALDICVDQNSKGGQILVPRDI